MKTILALFLMLLTFSIPSFGEVCTEFGPQTPRDISFKKGINKVKFSKAPSYKKMNLCNIHFHKNAEHKGPKFSVLDQATKWGGYTCNNADKVRQKSTAAVNKPVCKDLKPGDTVEVHWVFSSCDTKPGKGLGACLSDACANPQLRVETEVFVLSTEKSAVDFMNMNYVGQVKDYHQPGKLSRASAVEFLGSTTGPSYTEKTCSPLQVTWNVRKSCRSLNINTLGKWCESNVFSEDHAHGVRKLVTDPRLLSPIR